MRCVREHIGNSRNKFRETQFLRCIDLIPRGYEMQKSLSKRGRVLLLCTIAIAFSQATLFSRAFAQDTLQQNVIAGVSCAPSNNATGHVLCLEELANPNGGSPLLDEVSWQAPNSPLPPLTGIFSEPIEAPGTVDHATAISMPAGLLTGTAGCASAVDGIGTVICAIQGSDNGLYGVAIHPQPLGTTSPPVTEAQATPLVPLLIPGQVIKNFYRYGPPGSAPCTPVYPCTRVSGIGGRPSCAATEFGSGKVICAVLVVLQNSLGATINDLIGIAFDPRVPASSTNPSILGLANGANFYSNPSCASSTDPAGVNGVNGGKAFATCAIVYFQSIVSPNGTVFSNATLFGPSFDPRSGFDSGVLGVTENASFGQDPSCAAPDENKGAVICAIGLGLGSDGFVSNTMLGFAIDPIHKTTSTMNLGAPPSGDGGWTGFGCASPVDPNNTNLVACAGTTSNNQIVAVSFDPRTNTKTPFEVVPFADPNGSSATFATAPSCVPAKIINNQITCVVVDSFNDAIGFAATVQ
jgi:hypothetical protein